ncbi:hypothetical protein DFH09DRAFT_1072357 [Mycena vulgaris]|nr:hypothetical protein DFH09DRAFT_1072357 [Mycena vulgaris]
MGLAWSTVFPKYDLKSAAFDCRAAEEEREFQGQRESPDEMDINLNFHSATSGGGGGSEALEKGGGEGVSYALRKRRWNGGSEPRCPTWRCQDSGGGWQARMWCKDSGVEVALRGSMVKAREEGGGGWRQEPLWRGATLHLFDRSRKKKNAKHEPRVREPTNHDLARRAIQPLSSMQIMQLNITSQINLEAITMGLSIAPPSLLRLPLFTCQLDCALPHCSNTVTRWSLSDATHTHQHSLSLLQLSMLVGGMIWGAFGGSPECRSARADRHRTNTADRAGEEYSIQGAQMNSRVLRMFPDRLIEPAEALKDEE